ncbi:hypothetical protein [Sabulibacter ruber]|uniref:hypothetical protein n=1 Tax=Sabulibacter ruber TaxID=2811901 RepID=UPI001A95820E|nr:hypothetical protein [Sabulibacter ruber]
MIRHWIEIGIWILLTALGLYLYGLVPAFSNLDKLIALCLWSITAILNISRILKHSKKFFLKGHHLTIKRILKPKIEIDLISIHSWSQETYRLIGCITGEKIILNTQEGKTLVLWKQDNSSEFEKLSNNLNTLLERKYLETAPK